jgi:glycosyltransferase involved in cell wall biosynthesis
MAKRQVVHILSSIEKSLAFEWLLPRLTREYDVKVILLNPRETPLEIFLRERNIQCQRITLRGKRDFPFAFLRLLMLLLRLRPAVVHVHLLDAQRLALPAAWLARIKKRVYTRHNSTLHHRYYPAGIKYDRWSNWLATDIVSVSQATDYALFELEGVSRSKVTKIPHGFDFASFDEVTEERKEAVRRKWSIPRARPVIGLVSRFIEWKGLQFALPAIANFQKKNPDVCVVLANAQGPFAGEVNELLSDFSPGSVIRIPFEEDMLALYALFDLFIHVPVDEYVEAFGQVYIEALACGVPSIFTRSGIAAEFVENEVSALVVEHQSAEAIEKALSRLWTDNTLRNRLSQSGKSLVRSRFGIDAMIGQLQRMYDE